MKLKISFDIGEKIEDKGNKNINQKEEVFGPMEVSLIGR
jgi:hypothetical protein